MLKIPYIRIRQRDEIFFVTKFRADILLDYIDFHFRDPYTHLQNPLTQLKTDEYINRIQKQGIELESNERGIQRRLQLERIRNIAEYLKSDESNFLPNSILLSASINENSDFYNHYLDYENKEIGYFEFPEDVRFIIIDGQHRLGGLSLLDKKFQEQLELTTILLFNISIPTAAKLFSDINGKQKAVNRSLIYDLYDLIGTEYQNDITIFHSICEAFYTSKRSPLYRQIKMLGIGSGAISQSFFIDYAIDAVKSAGISIRENEQYIYEQLFFYFRAFQRTFPRDWPVPIDFHTIDQLDEHAKLVLRERKSQLVKTNGFGAILRLFPKVYNLSGGKFEGYLETISKLKGHINWLNDGSMGTGKSFQNKLLQTMENLLDLGPNQLGLF